MEKTNALMLRQNLGNVLKRLFKTGRPILVEKNRQAVAVLITIEDYHKRFVDVEADIKREEIVQRIANAGLSLPKGKSSVDLVRELRA